MLAAVQKRASLVRGMTVALVATLLGALLIIALASSAPARAVSGVSSAGRPAADCQPYASSPCLLPFPNNLFTRRDRHTSTGLRVALPSRAMPINKNGRRIGVGDYDRADGFSPGSALIVHIPGLDNARAFRRTGAVGLLDMSRAFARRQPIVVIDEQTGKRQLIWSELDANTSTPQSTSLLIHPGKNFTEGHTYAVALRYLRNSRGHALGAPSWFVRLRDDQHLLHQELSQRGRYARIFRVLGRAGISRRNLYEAWDFTVASRPDLTARLLSIRNNAFAQLGDHNLADGKVQGRAPAYQVTSSDSLNSHVRRVVGTFQVPCYLVTCGPTATTSFHYSSRSLDALPTQSPGNVAHPTFECIVPTSASPTHPARLVLSGHGLLETHADLELPYNQALAAEHNLVICAADWWGLSAPDELFDAGAVTDLNQFPIIVDRLQQGVLNTLYLGRLMLNPAGLAANPAFQSGGRPVIHASRLYYNGNSLGGIEGGTTTAVSPDVRRAVVGSTGVDFGGLLVQRSTDFAPFAQILLSAYPDRSMYSVTLDVIQQLWDRGEPDGYAQQMTSHPLPDTPSHTVMITVAYGDHQVTQYAAAVEARTDRGPLPVSGAGPQHQPLPRPQPVLRALTDRLGSLPRIGDRDLGQRSRRGAPAPRGQSGAGGLPHEPRSPLRPSRHPARSLADLRLPDSERCAGGRLRAPALPQRRLFRPHLAGDSLRARVDVHSVAPGKAAKGHAAVLGERDRQRAGSADSHEYRRAGHRGLLDQLKRQPAADTEEPFEERHDTVQQRASDHLVHSVVTSDVLAHDQRLAVRGEEARGVYSAGLLKGRLPQAARKLGEQRAGHEGPGTERPAVHGHLLQCALAANPTRGAGVEAAPAGIPQQRPCHLDRVGREVLGQPCRSRLIDQPFGEQEPQGQLLVVARSAHRHRQRLAVDPDLQRLFDGDQVTAAVVNDLDRGAAHHPPPRRMASSIAALGEGTAGPWPTTSRDGSRALTVRADSRSLARSQVPIVASGKRQ